MCGIAGKVSLTAKAVTLSEVRQMGKTLAHRGPDDAGEYVSPNSQVGLAHRRLSILDLSPLGHQPMRYLNRYVITFNGEIYNFQVERQALEKLGYTFTSQTDTEVILALYDQYGVHCLEHMRGMFAFAIYDEQTNSLFCARDRLGKKPFKYFHNGSVFMFASELKSILTQAEYQRQPDLAAIHHYLTYQYVPGSATGFIGLKKLPPANYLLLDCATGKGKIEQYWQLRYQPQTAVTETDWCQAIMTGLEESIRLRLIADVPVGAWLSGGLDSSAVVAIMSHLLPRPVKTFSIGWREDSHNELPFARQVAKHFKTDHTEFIVEPKAIEVVPELAAAYEEPYADTSALPTYYLSQLTRQHVSVTLNGDGGDENFAGYDRYSIYRANLYLKRYPAVSRLLAAAAHLTSQMPHRGFDRFTRWAQSLPLPLLQQYLSLVSVFGHTDKANLYTPAFAQAVAGQDSEAILEQAWRATDSPDPICQAVAADITTYLPGALLPKVDIASMQFALEARSPLLDHAFMEMAARIPINLKIKGLTARKYIFKQALSKMLPAAILHRRKQGFGVPLQRWFTADLNSYLASILLSPAARRRALFNPEAIKGLITLNSRGANRSSQLWALLTLELWFRHYFD